MHSAYISTRKRALCERHRLAANLAGRPHIDETGGGRIQLKDHQIGRLRPAVFFVVVYRGGNIAATIAEDKGAVAIERDLEKTVGPVLGGGGPGAPAACAP